MKDWKAALTGWFSRMGKHRIGGMFGFDSGVLVLAVASAKCLIATVRSLAERYFVHFFYCSVARSLAFLDDRGLE